MKRLIIGLCTIALGTAATAQDQTSDWPAGPITIVAPFPAGAGAETLMRAVSEELSQKWGVPVVTENKPGGNTIIAAKTVINGPTDGSMFLYSTAETLSSVPYIEPKPDVDLATALTPVIAIARSDLGLVARKDAPYDSVAELLDMARKDGLEPSVATLGVTSPLHYLTALLDRETKVSFFAVPYKGIPDATKALLSGEVDLSWANAFAVQGLVEGGQLKMLALSGVEPNPQFPDIPTFADLGYPGIVMPASFGLFANADVPDAILEALAGAVQEVMADEEFRRAAIEARGFRPESAAFDDFQALIADDTQKRLALD